MKDIICSGCGCSAPGDSLGIPGGWFHRTKKTTIDTTVNVTVCFCQCCQNVLKKQGLNLMTASFERVHTIAIAVSWKRGGRG